MSLARLTRWPTVRVDSRRGASWSADAVAFAALGVAVVAVSSSAPMIAYAAAPALAIAFWRNAIAVALIGPFAVTHRRGELVGLVGSQRDSGTYSLFAGAALAVHFGTWVPSTKLTTVAAATALAATQPVWQGIIAAIWGRRLPWIAWLGIGSAVVGAVLVTGADIGVSAAAVAGDALALAGGVSLAVYTALGERARTTTSTTTYTTVCYATCALLLLAVCVVAQVPLHGYPLTAWAAIAALTLGPQLMGHSLLNFALRRVAATTISVVVLLEVPGAALIGWVWLGQVPKPSAWPGLALLVAGVAFVLLAQRRPQPHVQRALD